MQTISTTPFGRRPVTAGLMDQIAQNARPAPVDSVDKWAVHENLSLARVDLGLSDRTLSVLNVLLSFHHERELTDGTSLIVFASNHSLCKRAHGMPESTLRRHLAALVAAGLIARHDSPNGKRYVRRGAGGDAIRAFGFDLTPLLIRAPEFAAAAETAKARANAMASLREEIVLLIRDATKLDQHARNTGAGATDAVMDRIVLSRRHLRRQLTLADLEHLRDTLRDLVDNMLEILTPTPVETPQETSKMVGCDAQNERHKDDSNIKPLDLNREGDCDLGYVLASCPDILPYAATPLRNWDDFIRLMARIAPMTGIDVSTWDDACRAMGPADAATTLAGIVQGIGRIRSPGAYLRTLSKRAREGHFTPKPMIAALQSQAA